MNLLDLILIVFIIWQLVRGVGSGFVRQIISLLSLLLAFVLASVISPIIVPWFGSAVSRQLLSLIIFSIILLIVGLGAEFISKRIAQRVRSHKKIDDVDKISGAVLGLVFAIVSIWLLAAIFSSTSWSFLSRQIKDSRTVQTVDKVMPPPPSFIAQLQNYLSDLNFPKVFIGIEPQLDKPASLPSEENVRAVALKSQDSVVKIVAGGCGNYLSDGSGFVAANGLVVTNAHVVAGVSHPSVVDRSGNHNSTVVYFDPDVDLAILRTNGLAGAPLPINYNVAARGSQGVVLGYPGGGGYSAVSAVVIKKIIAFGRNIYGTGEVKRPVYALSTKVVPGNSGGPFININGEVVGVIFASSQTDSNVGYSLSAETLKAPLSAAKNTSSTVSSGSCMAH